MKKKNKKIIFVALSGGVDSSVAVLLLKKQGYYVVGVFMRCWRDSIATPAVKTCMEKDAEDARKVAEQLEIPFYVWDFEKEYKKRVVDYMVDGYRKGITPNPDVMCNKEIKFGLFLEKALKMGADYVATGHYVRLSRIAFRKQHNFLPARKFASLSPRHSSLRSETNLSGLRDVPRDNSASPIFSFFVAKDKNKDQSYFLWTLTQEQLKYCLFPIGDYLKSEVRKIAKKAGLLTAEKKDSQGICFLGKVTLDEFLGKYIPEKKGDIVDVSGGKIGEHKGAHFYTIGQRHIGVEIRPARRILGVGGNPKSEIRKDRQPYYVAEKDIKTNTLVVAEGNSSPSLYKNEIILTDVNFINPRIPSLIRANRRIDILVRVRYRQPLVSAILKIENLKLKIEFDAPVKFVAPGQSAVFYLPAEASAKEGDKKGEMLGGGVII